MRKTDIELLVVSGSLIGWVVTIGYAITANQKLKSVAKKLDIAVDDMVDKQDLDIPKEMIRDVLANAVDFRYRNMLNRACEEAVQKNRNDMDERIKSVVNKEFENQKEEVAKELKHKINSLDISSIRREVINEAKETAAEKFKSDLDDILEKHNEELEQVTQIYSSIAAKMKGA